MLIKEKERRKRIRVFGYITIAISYLAGFYFLLVGSIPFYIFGIGLVAIPLLAQFILGKTVPLENTEDGDSVRLLAFPIASIVGTIVYIFLYGPSIIETITATVIALIVLVACVTSLYLWAHEDGRRITVVGVAFLTLGLLAAATFGPPLVSWSSIGFGAALFVAILGLGSDPSGRPNHSSGSIRPFNAEYGENYTERGAWHLGDGRTNSILKLFSEGQFAIQTALEPRDREGEPTFWRGNNSVLVALSALANLGFVSDQFARTMLPYVSFFARVGFNLDGEARSNLSLLYYEFTYAIARIEAHNSGAPFSAFAKDQDESSNTYRPGGRHG